MPAVMHADWIVDMLDAFPDDLQRYEVIDGVLYVTPAQSDGRQFVSGEFYVRLHVPSGLDDGAAPVLSRKRATWRSNTESSATACVRRQAQRWQATRENVPRLVEVQVMPHGFTRQRKCWT